MSDERLEGHAGPLHVRKWEPAEPQRVVVLVHGYGEHVGRYEHVAEALVRGGAVVWAGDHAGHGRSTGDRVVIADYEPVVDDVRQVIGAARQAHPDLPVAMIGHSMGGMIATRYAERHSGELAGLVLSGPLVGPLPPLGALLAADPIPDDPLDPDLLSRDPAVGEAYAADPLVWHGAFQRPTLSAIAHCLLEVALDADRVTGPVLWQHGDDDQLVLVDQVRRGIALLRNAEVEERIYPGARHEIFNETNRDEVLAHTTEFVERVARS